jgi:P-type Ca2+ transporter type 2C
VEPAEKDLMDRKPRPTRQNVLTLSSLMMIAWQSLSMTYLTFGVYYLSVYHGMFEADTPAKQKSLAFILLCTLQLAQSFLSRSILNSSFKVGILGNKWLVIAFAVSYGLMLFGLYVPPVAQWLKLEGIGGVGWAPIIVCLILHIAIVEIGKYTARLLFANEVVVNDSMLLEKEAPAIIVLESMDRKEKTVQPAANPTYKDFSEPKESNSDSSATMDKR